jgi:ATP-dependent Clp protease ATP-binding subunit ClpC
MERGVFGKGIVVGWVKLPQKSTMEKEEKWLTLDTNPAWLQYSKILKSMVSSFAAFGFDYLLRLPSMNNTPSIPIYALVESYGSDLVQARLLQPLTLSVVANSWSVASQRLLRSLKKHIRKTPPTHWARTRPMDMPVHRKVPLRLDPAKDDLFWTEPIQLEIDFFSWTINPQPSSSQHKSSPSVSNDPTALQASPTSIAGAKPFGSSQGSSSYSQWFCPALASTLISKTDEATDAFLQTQLKSMLARIHDVWELEQVLATFQNRQFRIRELTRLTPEELAEAYATKQVGTKKVHTDTLRSVATRMATWQRSPTLEQSANIAELEELLLSTNPCSVLLVGPSGVGKTSIVYEWACSANAKEVWATSGSRLVSGMTGLGMWQKRCQQVIRETHDAKAVLHVGSLIELVESGKINGQPGVASVLRGAIDRGRLLAIAECTPEQMAIVEREDPILLRSFTKLEVNAPDDATTRRILMQVGQQLTYEKQLANQPKKKRNSSTSALNSNWNSTSNSATSSKSTEAHRASLPQLPADAPNLFDPAAIDELIQLHQRFSTYSAMPGQPIIMMRSMAESWPESGFGSNIIEKRITDTDIVQRFSNDTGLPLFLLDDLIPLEPAKVQAELASNVIGQPEPVVKLVQLVTMLKARLNRSDRPLASLLLIGPTGVGKTETAKALARLLYRDQARMIRIDMSEYSQPWSALRLIGTTSGGDGTLTSPIRDQPFSVVLLDEFEKCHPSVLDLLLQVLGEGRLTDSLGRIADFRNAVVIMTSNLGVESFHGKSFGFGEDDNQAYDHFLREVKRHVRPEFLGRLDQIIPYRSLPLEVVRQIADREIAKVATRSGVRYHPIEWTVESDARDVLANLGLDPAYGARPLRREIERNIVIPLSDSFQSKRSDAPFSVRFVASKDPRHPIEAKVTKHDSNASASDETLPPSVVPTPEETRSNQVKNVLEYVRDIRYRSNLLIQSQPYQGLQNSVERLDREVSRCEKQLKKLTAPRRMKTANAKLEYARQEFGAAKKQLDSIDALVGQVQSLHFHAMDRWYMQNDIPQLQSEGIATPTVSDYSVDLKELSTKATRLGNDLKEYLIGLQSGAVQRRDLHSLVILCNPIAAAKPLWDAYRKLANLNNWRVLLFGLTAYDPLWDPLSKEFQIRQSGSKKPIEIPKSREPAFRLLRGTKDDPKRAKEVDVYRIADWRELEVLEERMLGIVLQLDQGAISNWLGEEEGVHHFVMSTGATNVRHRARVILYPGKLIDWDPPSDWKETPSLNTRDPRRTFYSSDQRLISHLIQRRVFVDSTDPISSWVDMIQQEGDSMLWHSIGYSPIPNGATMREPVYSSFLDDMPF